MEWGKITLSVPGAKKIAAKLNAATEPVTEAELHVYMTGALSRGKVTGGVIINSYAGLKNSFRRHIFALYAAEIAEKLIPYNAENEIKYMLISRVWQIFETTPCPYKVLAAFTLRLLKLSGYNFKDYLINSGAAPEKSLFEAVKNLSNCSGDAAAQVMCNDEQALWNYIESYLINYIKTPSVGIFLKKINFQDV